MQGKQYTSPVVRFCMSLLDQFSIPKFAAYKTELLKPHSIFFRGKLLQDLKQDELAIRDFTHEIKMNKDAPIGDCYALRALSHARMNDMEDALRDANEAIKKEPKRAQHFVTRAKIYALMHNEKQSLQDVQHALQIDDSCSEARCELAKHYAGNHKVMDAMSELYTAINSGSADAYFESGLINMNQLKDVNHALDDFTSYIKDGTDITRIAMAHVHRGTLMMNEKKKYDQALKDFNRAIQLEPNYADAFTKRASLYAGALQNETMAAKDRARAQALNPLVGTSKQMDINSPAKAIPATRSQSSNSTFYDARNDCVLVRVTDSLSASAIVEQVRQLLSSHFMSNLLVDMRNSNAELVQLFVQQCSEDTLIGMRKVALVSTKPNTNSSHIRCVPNEQAALQYFNEYTFRTTQPCPSCKQMICPCAQ